VLFGYPPFLKDVIDSGIAEGISWRDYSVKWVAAGEVFSEAWRSLVGTRLGSTQVCYDSASLYGTADAGVLGNETPLKQAFKALALFARQVNFDARSSSTHRSSTGFMLSLTIFDPLQRRVVLRLSVVAR